jgi:hypothetical protein
MRRVPKPLPYAFEYRFRNGRTMPITAEKPRVFATKAVRGSSAIVNWTRPGSRLSASYFDWFNADVIIDRVTQSLFAAEIALGSLHAHVSEQELNLFELASGEMAQSCAGAPKIMRSNVR